MPFKIIRNDITQLKVDCIINSANFQPLIGEGVDSQIYQKAGIDDLLTWRKGLGGIDYGGAAISPSFNLPCKFIVHTVAPIFNNNLFAFTQCLKKCYMNCLNLAIKHHCQSIAFPLLASDNNGCAKDLALNIAVETICQYILTHDELDVYLVVFDKTSYVLSKTLQSDIESYIDQHYVNEFYNQSWKTILNRNKNIHYIDNRLQCAKCLNSFESDFSYDAIDALINQLDASFNETLLAIIDSKGLKDSQVYKRANMSRQLFSKIRCNSDYKVSKSTAISLAIALQLNLEQTNDLLQRAGYTLSHSSRFDIIVEYFIVHNNYNIFEINEVLFKFDLPLLGM